MLRKMLSTCLRSRNALHTANDANGRAKFVPQRENKTSETAVPHPLPQGKQRKNKFQPMYTLTPTPLVARSKACDCGCSLAGIAGSNPAGGTDVRLL